METPSQNQNQDTAPTLAQAKAICAIRDRLWKYTRKSFRRFAEPRDAEALLLHLADLHKKLQRAEAKAVRVIPADEIERCIKRREELNAEIYAKRAKYVEPGYQHFSTDAQSVREELAQANQNIIEAYQRSMEPDEAASIPIYGSQYQPRCWAQLCEAGLVHDEMIRDPAEAARFLEAKPKQSATNIPETFEAIIKQAEETRRSIWAKCSNGQVAEKHPALARLRRAAWNAAPAQVREKIESYLRLHGKKTASLDDRFSSLDEYVSMGAEAFEKRIEEARRARDEYWEATIRLRRDFAENQKSRFRRGGA
jgi:hypothetical protein